MTPELVTLIIAGVSVLAKELLYRYTMRVSEGHRIGEMVHDEMIAEIEAVADVSVHIDGQ